MFNVPESTLQKLERDHVDGIASASILEFLSSHNIHFGEATLRKWVQLGLLPRSVRVGSKGKHRGSKGLYPVRVVRRILNIKSMMARNLTIEEIQGQFLFVRGDIEELEQTLSKVFEVLETMSTDRSVKTVGMHAVAADLSKARTLASELIKRLESVEQRLITQHTQVTQREVAAS